MTRITPSTQGGAETVGVDAAERKAELVERFREAVASIPLVRDHVDAGDQFNAYESAWNDEDCDDEVREYLICVGPVTNACGITRVDGKGKADLIEAALKLAQHVALSESASS